MYLGNLLKSTSLPAFRKIIQSRWVVPGILVVNFLIRICIYYNTSLFYSGDSKPGLDAIEFIRLTGSHPLRVGRSQFLNSHIGYFFKYVLGNFDYYFIFNCLLGTLACYFLYIFVLHLWGRKSIGVMTVLLLTIYSEFSALSSVFYTQIIEIFMFCLLLFLLIKLDKSKKLVQIIFYIFIISILINASLLFKQTLIFVWILFMIYSLFVFILFHNPRHAIKFFSLSISIILLNLFLSSINANIGYVYSSKDISNDFLFFGHTMYGGDGGEGSFVYKENEELYKKNYQKYLRDRNIENPSQETRNDFQLEEIKKFIFNSPHKWIWLQALKFTRTFGVIPEGITFRILSTGLFQRNWILAALFLQIPFVFFIVSFVLFFSTDLLNKSYSKAFFMLYIMLFLYWMTAIVFFGATAERYRILVVVSFLIPCIAFFITEFRNRRTENFKILSPRMLILFLIFGIWLLQAYSALVINKNRYLAVVEQIRSGELR